jgi:hypothetical protein
VPPAVAAAQEDTTRQHVRRGALLAALIYTYVALNGIFVWMLGLHDAKLILSAQALWLGALAASVVTIARPTYANLAVMFFFGTAASTWVTTIWGPHLIVPLLLVVHALLYSQVRRWALRLVFIGVACLGWSVSVFGERWGLFPKVVHFVDGAIIVRPPSIHYPELPTTLYLYAAVLAVIILPAVVVGFLRTSYHRADLQTRLQTWQLHQLVPEGAPARSGAGGPVTM